MEFSCRFWELLYFSFESLISSFTLGSWFGRLFLIEGLGSLGWDSANLVNDLSSLFVNEEICLLGLV